MKSHLLNALTPVEHETERLLAWLRTLVFLAITAVFWASGALGRDHMALFSIAGLGALALASLTLAWSGFFPPWLPWVFATPAVAILLPCFTVFINRSVGGPGLFPSLP